MDASDLVRDGAAAARMFRHLVRDLARRTADRMREMERSSNLDPAVVRLVRSMNLAHHTC